MEEFEFVKAGQAVAVNGRKFDGPVNVVRRSTLGEISFVDLGADLDTSANVAAKGKESRVMEDVETKAEQAVAQDAGTETPVVQAMPAGRQAQAAEGKQAPPSGKVEVAAESGVAPDVVAEMRERAAAEQERIAAVRKVCGDAHATIAAKAIAEGWDATRTELEVLRASRPKAPAVHVTDDPAAGLVLEAACMLTGGIRADGLVTSHGEQALEAAGRRFRGGIGLQELLLEAAWANGYSGRNFRQSRDVLRFAFAQNVEARFSTVDIGGILSNVANKFLLDGFFSVERTWRNVCAVRNVSDFKTVTSYRLIGTDQYEKVAPGRGTQAWDAGRGVLHQQGRDLWPHLEH